uniref:Uncharacterized protein n=1 Tax=Ciona savignyi TaxID=51511 RepID=H2Y8S7_CIOSA
MYYSTTSMNDLRERHRSSKKVNQGSAWSIASMPKEEIPQTETIRKENEFAGENGLERSVSIYDRFGIQPQHILSGRDEFSDESEVSRNSPKISRQSGPDLSPARCRRGAVVGGQKDI